MEETYTDTELKLQEVNIQLMNAVEDYDNEAAFRAFINSFLAAARSVTLMMQKESSGSEELKKWYTTQMESLKELPIMNIFKELRNDTIHRKVVRPIAHSVPIREEKREYVDDNTQYPSMQIWVFDEANKYIPNDSGNILRLCEEYYLILDNLVYEWLYEKTIIENPREVIKQLQDDRNERKNFIEWLKHLLGQSQLTISLFNDILNNLGDSSHNDLAKHLVKEIKTTLYPAKLKNTPIDVPENLESRNNQSEKRHLYMFPILLSPTEATQDGNEGVYATIRNSYTKDEHDKYIYGNDFGYEMWGVQLKGHLAPSTYGFSTPEEAADAARRAYTILRY